MNFFLRIPTNFLLLALLGFWVVVVVVDVVEVVDVVLVRAFR